MLSGALTLLTLSALSASGYAQQCADQCFSAAKAYDHSPDFSRPWGCSYLMTTRITPPVITSTVSHTRTDVFRTDYTTLSQYWALSTKDAWKNRRYLAQTAHEPTIVETVTRTVSSPVRPTAHEIPTPMAGQIIPERDTAETHSTSLKAESVCPAPRRGTSMVVPGYASKCRSNQAFSSACSCLGFHATTTTVEPCTSTIHAWDVVRSRTTRTVTKTIDVSPKSCQTPYMFHLAVMISDFPVGVLSVDGAGHAQVLEEFGEGGAQPAILYNGFNGHLEHGDSYAVVDSFDRTAPIRFQDKAPGLRSSSIFALTCHLGPACDASLRCIAGKDSRNVTSVCLSPNAGLYIGDEVPEDCVPATFELFNVPGSMLDHSIPLGGAA